VVILKLGIGIKLKKARGYYEKKGSQKELSVLQEKRGRMRRDLSGEDLFGEN